jgi:hypothetical protein
MKILTLRNFKFLFIFFMIINTFYFKKSKRRRNNNDKKEEILEKENKKLKITISQLNQQLIVESHKTEELTKKLKSKIRHLTLL